MLGVAGHHNDTGLHIRRMAAYARALAEARGWDEERCELIELAAPVHDTGKIGIPDAILTKPGALDEAEWKVMREHTRIGCEILERSEAPVFRLAAEVALCHHEKWDGSGYPRGLRGEAIPESARIVAIADVFDALSMRRPYKEPWPIARIIEHHRSGSGTHFDPDLVKLFLADLVHILEIKAIWDTREPHVAHGTDRIVDAGSVPVPISHAL